MRAAEQEVPVHLCGAAGAAAQCCAQRWPLTARETLWPCSVSREGSGAVGVRSVQHSAVGLQYKVIGFGGEIAALRGRSRRTMLEVFSSRADCVTHELLSVWPGSGCSELRQNRRRVLCVALCAVPCILVSALVAVIGECPPHPHGDAQPPSHLLGCPRGAPKHLLLQLPASATAPRASPRGRASQPHLSCRGTSFASHLPNSLPVSAPASVVLTSPTLLPRVPQRLGRFPREMLLFLGHGEGLEQQQGALPPPRSFPGYHRDGGGDGESGA